MAAGIRDRVVIIGMGCTRFGERWDADAEDLIVEAFTEAVADAGIATEQLEAAWLGTSLEEQSVGKGAVALSTALRLPYVPATRVENQCASGTEAFRAAVYAVAAGACDIALAVGAEKLKDTGYGGLPQRTRGRVNDLYWANISAPGSFAQLASAYQTKYGIHPGDFRQALAHISVKSHENALANERAHIRKRITQEDVLSSPLVADPLRLYDCCGVSDGAACAIVTTPELARELGKTELISVKALQLAVSNGVESQHASWDGSYFATTRHAARRAYAEAGVKNPRRDIGILEVHDCFSITELVTLEDLDISRDGEAVKDVLDGFYDANGQAPCQTDGGLKCFGHPIGASGLRMLYEIYLQLLGRAGDRQMSSDPRFGLTHNLGGQPNANVCSVAILGHAPD